jgi:hypothetical protein
VLNVLNLDSLDFIAQVKIKTYLLLTCEQRFASLCLRYKTDVEVYVLLTDAGSDY